MPFTRDDKCRNACTYACFGVAAALGIAPSAHADLVNIAPERDNTIYEHADGLLSNGAGQHFFAGNNSSLLSRRGLIAFDVASSIPADFIITGATLSLHSSQGNYPADVALHRLLAGWGEGASDAPGSEGGGANAAPGDATWIHGFYDTNLWTDPGGDFTPAPSASQHVTDAGYYSWSGPALIDDVQFWLDSPSDNHGWILLGQESAASTAIRFDSRENPTVEFRPMLTIEYSTIPAPAALAVLAAGLLTPRRRRR